MAAARSLHTAAAIAAMLAAGAVATPLRHTAKGFALVAGAADLPLGVRRLAALGATPVSDHLTTIPTAGGTLRARVYAPAGPPRRTVLLVTGVHPAGIDEPRLMRLSRHLASRRVIVVTPEIPELMRFELSPAVTDRIEQAARWLAIDSGLAGRSRIGLMGVSFSGGLAVVAAGRAPIRDHLRFVFSFGGHDELGAVVDYLSSVPGAQTPHDYGVALVMLNVADRLVPADQVGPLRDAVRRFLRASYADRIDRAAAAREFETLREVARTLPEPSATLLAHVNDRDVGRLGPLLRPHAQRYIEQAALSPARAPAPAAPLFLLHGASDTVIPAAESQRMAARLRGVVPVRLLVSGVISHAEADMAPQVAEVWRLARFWGDLLTQ